MITELMFGFAGLATIGGTGLLTGLRLGARHAAPAPTNLCDCGHVHSVHDEAGGPCRTEIERPRFDPLAGRRIGREYVVCPCRAYDGPPALEWFPVLPPLPSPSRKDTHVTA